MPRKTFKKIITTPEILAEINPKNKKLMESYLKHKNTICSDLTVKNYRSDLNIFFAWNVLENDNKFFINVKKRQLAEFFGYCVNDLKWSTSRYARMRACLSSFSDFIERYYDEEYEDFRNIVKQAVDKMTHVPRREKTVLSETQVNSLLHHLSVDLKRPQEACLLALAICTGARKSELLRFTTEIIDENNTCYEGIFLETTKKIKTKGKTKEGKLLNKYIIKDLFMPYYKTWLKEREQILKEKGVEDHKQIFIKMDGTPAQESTIEYWIEKWEKFLEVPFYLHCLRHYTCTYLTRIGLETELIVEIFGWTSSDMYKIYNDLGAKDIKWKSLEKAKELLKK